MSKQPHIVFLPGMGADHRLYAGISAEGFTCTYLNWIAPERDETLRGYSSRLIKNLGEGPFVFVGSSFGAIVALELSTIILTNHVVIIGVPKEPNGFSPFVKQALKVGTALGNNTSWLPPAGITHVFQVGKVHRPLFKDMLQGIPSTFIPFALRSMREWKPNYSVDVTQLLGSKDWLVKKQPATNMYLIKQAGHCLTLDNPKEVNTILNSILEHYR